MARHEDSPAHVIRGHTYELHKGDYWSVQKWRTGEFIGRICPLPSLGLLLLIPYPASHVIIWTVVSWRLLQAARVWAVRAIEKEWHRIKKKKENNGIEFVLNDLLSCRVDGPRTIVKQASNLDENGKSIPQKEKKCDLTQR